MWYKEILEILNIILEKLKEFNNLPPININITIEDLNLDNK